MPQLLERGRRVTNREQDEHVQGCSTRDVCRKGDETDIVGLEAWGWCWGRSDELTNLPRGFLVDLIGSRLGR